MTRPTRLLTGVRVLLLALAFAIGTAWYGWWTVPVLAFGYAAMDATQWRRGWLSALAAVTAWGAILLWGLARNPMMWTTSARVAGMLSTSPWLLLALTLSFAALLAGPAAVFGAAVRRGVTRAATAPTRYPPAT